MSQATALASLQNSPLEKQILLSVLFLGPLTDIHIELKTQVIRIQRLDSGSGLVVSRLLWNHSAYHILGACLGMDQLDALHDCSTP